MLQTLQDDDRTAFSNHKTVASGVKIVVRVALIGRCGAAAVAGNRSFAVDAYLQAASAAGGNVVLSPASIRLALAMTWAGADGVS